MEPPFNLLRRFAVLSLICIALISAMSAFILSGFLTEHMVRRDAVVSKEFIESVIKVENTWSYFVERDQGQADAVLESFFTLVSRLPDVVRANVYAQDHSIIWSSNEELIGQNLGANSELEEAFAGELEVEFGTVGAGEKPEHVFFDIQTAGTRFVEAYIPIWDPQGGTVVGVVEIYKLPLALFDAIERGRHLVWLSTTAGGVLLYTALFWIVRRGSLVIRKQQERLVDVETMAAIGEMASAVAHGIRNPLASIRSSAELMQEEDLEGARESAADIIAEAERLDQWVRELLLFARSEQSEPDQVDINEILRDSLQGLSPAMERQGVALAFDAQQTLPLVQGHAAPLGHVINCIVTNALDAMSGRGQLSVATRLEASGPRIAIDISDSGPGISRDVAKSVYRPFFTTKSNGLGLGLALARRIVVRYGGALELASAEGQGTTFTIRLPMAAEVRG